jgi:hypothetical protein
LAPASTWTLPSNAWEALGSNTPTQDFMCGNTSGLLTISPKCGEAISSSPSHTSTRFTGSFLPDRLEGHERAQEGILRSFLVHRAASHAHRPQPGLLHQARFQRRRTPFRRHELLHVVHEVNGQGGLRAHIHAAEHAGLARRRYQLHIGESGLLGQLRHVLGALRIVAVLRGNRRQRDPLLQALQVLIVHFRHLRQHRRLVRILRSGRGQRGRGGQYRAGHGALYEIAPAQTIDCVRHGSLSLDFKALC